MKKCLKCKLDKSIEDFYTGKCWCKKCSQQAKKEWHTANKAKVLEYNKKRRLLFPEQHAQYKHNSYIKHKDALKTIQKQWNDNNKDKVKAYKKAWRKQNAGRINSWTAKRYAAKRQRTPKWLTPLHFKQIETFYEASYALSKEFGISMSVDHIVPLQGDNVSGLHVPWNLQIIPLIDNCIKNSTF